MDDYVDCQQEDDETPIVESENDVSTCNILNAHSCMRKAIEGCFLRLKYFFVIKIVKTQIDCILLCYQKWKRHIDLLLPTLDGTCTVYSFDIGANKN